MKNFIFCLFLSVFCFGQENDLWYPFFLENSNTMGFKDKNGKVMVEPKFFAPFSTGNFNTIYAVNEINGDKYYLLKNGKKVGIDSVYIFDTEYAKESEGKIKFRDYKTDKVGFFDKNGKIVIPAIYNDAGDFHNGIAMVMKDGTRKCWKEDNGKQPEYPNCEHWSWEGKTLMINSKNQELFEIPKQNFSGTIDYADIYKNFKLNETVDSDIYTSYKGNEGNTYSFYSLENDFKKWFETKFISDFKTNGKISEKYFGENILLQRNEKSKDVDKSTFLKNYDKKINKLFNEYLQNKYDIDFFDENMFKEENSELSIDVRLTPKSENKNGKSVLNFHQESIVFKKIGNHFFITSSP